jgi:hypothetical protein
MSGIVARVHLRLIEALDRITEGGDAHNNESTGQAGQTLVEEPGTPSSHRSW